MVIFYFRSIEVILCYTRTCVIDAEWLARVTTAVVLEPKENKFNFFMESFIFSAIIEIYHSISKIIIKAT